jgi:heme exporter protein A
MDERETASAPAAPDAAIVVRELQCRRGDRVLFAPTSFVVAPGSIVWVRGANGQGKTTLLRTLAGLSVPAAGAIVRNGERQPLYLAHANALKDDLTVAESLRFLLQLAGEPIEPAEIEAEHERHAVDSRRNPFVRPRSPGQRRRVALARLAAQREPLPWLLDEPFDALDTAGVAVVADVIAEHARRGGSVVLTSHLPVPIDAPVPTVVQLHEPAMA